MTQLIARLIFVTGDLAYYNQGKGEAIFEGVMSLRSFHDFERFRT
jgi:hypothetical protein